MRFCLSLILMLFCCEVSLAQCYQSSFRTWKPQLNCYQNYNSCYSNCYNGCNSYQSYNSCNSNYSYTVPNGCDSNQSYTAPDTEYNTSPNESPQNKVIPNKDEGEVVPKFDLSYNANSVLYREWTDDTGYYRRKGIFISATSNEVKIRTLTGIMIVPLYRLSQKDLNYINQYKYITVQK